MSAVATQAAVQVLTNTRRVPRVPLTVPADVTVLRSGIPFLIPGRSLSVGERGLGMVLSAELHPGDPVCVEFRLPDVGLFRLKAVVRYQALLRCGLEFVSLTSEQQTLIEHWTRKKSATHPPPAPPAEVAQSAAAPLTLTTTALPLVGTPKRKHHRPTFRPALRLVLGGMLLLGGFLWWHWQRAWNELESPISGSQSPSEKASATVPAEVMEKLATHKVDPIYPEAARQANIQGAVVLDLTIGTNGAVVDVHPVSGPDELTPAAVDAVKWWRFEPYLVNGQAVPVKTTVAVDFGGN
jgi:TonB family protein